MPNMYSAMASQNYNTVMSFYSKMKIAESVTFKQMLAPFTNILATK